MSRALALLFCAEAQSLAAVESFSPLVFAIDLTTETDRLRTVIMRYQNWDVLLFPEDSKTPIQEFKTACFVTKDYGQCREASRSSPELTYRRVFFAFYQLFKCSSVRDR